MLYKKSKNTITQRSLVILAGIIFLSIHGIAQTANIEPNSENKNIVGTGDTIISEKSNANNELKIADQEKELIYEFVEQMPEFEGGEIALLNYLANNIEYPKKANQANIQGRVLVTFIVLETGELIDIKANNFPINGQSLADEAIRVVKNMPRWKPGKQKGKTVKVSFTLPIMFRIH